MAATAEIAEARVAVAVRIEVFMMHQVAHANYATTAPHGWNHCYACS